MTAREIICKIYEPLLLWNKVGNFFVLFVFFFGSQMTQAKMTTKWFNSCKQIPLISHREISWETSMSVTKHQKNKSGVQTAHIFLEKKNVKKDQNRVENLYLNFFKISFLQQYEWFHNGCALHKIHPSGQPFKPQCPHTNSPTWSPYISFKN